MTPICERTTVLEIATTMNQLVVVTAVQETKEVQYYLVVTTVSTVVTEVLIYFCNKIS